MRIIETKYAKCHLLLTAFEQYITQMVTSVVVPLIKPLSEYFHYSTSHLTMTATSLITSLRCFWGDSETLWI